MATVSVETHSFLAAPHDEEGLDVMLFQVGIALTPVPWLHFIVPIQVLQSCPRNVDPPSTEIVH